MTIKFIPGHYGVLVDIEDDIDINKALSILINQIEYLDPGHNILPLLTNVLEVHNEETGLE